MKKLLLTFIILIAATTPAFAATPTPEPVIVDQKCLGYLFYHASEGIICNEKCTVACIDSNHACDPEDEYKCLDGSGGTVNLVWKEGVLEAVDEDVRDSVRIIGIDLGPEEQATPRLIRMMLFGFFSFSGAMAFIYGMFGLVKISTAGGNAENYEEGIKIFKNALLGAGLSAGSVMIVQIGAVLTGLQGNIFNFYFVPEQGVEVDITFDFLENGPCLPEQVGIDPNGAPHDCGDDGRWIP
jgi:hypothetical protein